MYRASFIVSVLPGVVLIASGYAAALVAFRIVRQSSRGRARSAMAWISGFAIGLFTMLLFPIALPTPHPSVSAEGIVGAFVGPFIGILYGRWVRPEKKKRRPIDIAQMASRQP
jgi:membrane associated rhomboid family serine protease